MKTKYALLLITIFAAALLAACEVVPGEITGKVTYSDGRAASVMIKVFDTSNNAVHTTSSSTGGTYYTGRRIPPGAYTLRAFKGDEQVGEDYEVTVEPDASVVCNMVV